MLPTIALNFVNFEDVAFLASTPQVSFIYVFQQHFKVLICFIAFFITLSLKEFSLN